MTRRLSSRRTRYLTHLWRTDWTIAKRYPWPMAVRLNRIFKRRRRADWAAGEPDIPASETRRLTHLWRADCLVGEQIFLRRRRADWAAGEPDIWRVDWRTFDAPINATLTHRLTRRLTHRLNPIFDWSHSDPIEPDIFDFFAFGRVGDASIYPISDSLSFGFCDFGFRILRFRILRFRNFGFRISQFRISDFAISDFGFRNFGFRISDFGFRIRVHRYSFEARLSSWWYKKKTQDYNLVSLKKKTRV